jgi:hypothetical protein
MTPSCKHISANLKRRRWSGLTQDLPMEEEEVDILISSPEKQNKRFLDFVNRMIFVTYWSYCNSQCL